MNEINIFYHHFYADQSSCSLGLRSAPCTVAYLTNSHYHTVDEFVDLYLDLMTSRCYGLSTYMSVGVINNLYFVVSVFCLSIHCRAPMLSISVISTAVQSNHRCCIATLAEHKHCSGAALNNNIHVSSILCS